MKPNPIALLIEGDKASRRLLRVMLESQHYRLFEKVNGQLGLAAAEACQPDVIILEFSLPDMDGLAVLQQLRQSGRAPVLMLSDSNRENDIVAALDGGANDVLPKPFNQGELLARLRVLQRWIPGESDARMLIDGDLKIDSTEHLVTLGDYKIDLTRTEEALLQVLAAYAGKVVTCRHLLHSVWGAEKGNQGHCLRVFISNLRRKLEWTRGRAVIETCGSLGYRLLLRDIHNIAGEAEFTPEAGTESNVPRVNPALMPPTSRSLRFGLGLP